MVSFCNESNKSGWERPALSLMNGWSTFDTDYVTVKDNVVTFEELGVDRLFVDESHYFKNLFTYSKMRNVGGISQVDAQKSSDLFMKGQYLDEITDSKGIIFTADRTHLRNKIRRKNMDDVTLSKAKDEISKISSKLKTLRKEIALCDDIAERSKTKTHISESSEQWLVILV